MGPLINLLIGRKGGSEWVDYQEHELEAERLIRSNTLYNHQHSMIRTFQIQPDVFMDYQLRLRFV